MLVTLVERNRHRMAAGVNQLAPDAEACQRALLGIAMRSGRVSPERTGSEETEMVRMPFMKERTLDIASERDIRLGIKRALDDLRMTLPELRAQARSGEFSSQRARIVWSAIRDVVPKD